MLEKVEFYSGSRSDEVPRALWIGGSCYRVKAVIRREIIGSLEATAGCIRLFVLEMEGGAICQIREAAEAACGWILEGDPFQP